MGDNVYVATSNKKIYKLKEDGRFEKTNRQIKQSTVEGEQVTINSMMKWLYRQNETYIDGFDFKKLKKDGEPFEASGASEGKMEAIMTLNCNVKLGRNFKGKQAFVLLDLGHVNDTLNSQGVEKIDGVIGADFLKENNAIIDYGQRKLFLQLESF